MREEVAHLVPHMDCDAANGELKGLVLPYEIRVRTTTGIHLSNSLFLSREETIKVIFEDGTSFAGTPIHRLCTDVQSDTWVTMRNLEVGMLVACLDHKVRVVSKELGGAQAVADICVPGPHNYVLDNGVVSHNSLVATTQMAINMATNGYKVVVVPLEMSKVEMTARFIANRAQLDVTRILQHRLTENEQGLAFNKYAKWVKKVKKRGGRLTVFKPLEDLSIEEVFSAVNAYDADVVLIDYISLLKGADSDDAWQKLGAMARLAKINAEATNRVNILLCQVSEDGKIRYARSISEHSTNSMIWNAKKEERQKEIGRITVEQPKSRNSRSFPFDIGVHWAHMSVVDVEQADGVGDVPEPMDNMAE